MSSSIALTVRSGIGTATATILSRLRDKELIPGPSPATLLCCHFRKRRLQQRKVDRLLGPNQATFAGNTIFIEEAGADVQEGDS
jgi:hypothetical protein